MKAPFGPQVPSPCVSICRMEPKTGLCAGCLRTRREIADWPHLTDEQKDSVWVSIWERKAARKQGDPDT